MPLNSHFEINKAMLSCGILDDETKQQPLKEVYNIDIHCTVV